MSQKREKYINLAVCAAAFGLMLFLNFITPYFSDDWHFKFVWKEHYTVENDELLRSFGGLLESAENYYKLSGGRVLCHFVLFIFDNADKWVFNIVNSLMLVLFALLICKLIQGDRKQGMMWLPPLIFLYIFVFYKIFGDVMLWVSGAVNYLWPAALLLLAARLTENDIKRISVGKFIFTCIIVLLSSMTNEVTGGMLAILIFLTLIERGDKFSVRHALLFAMTVMGIAVIVAAPGNNVRLVTMYESQSPFATLKLYYDYYFRYCWPFIYINIFSIVYFYSKKKDLISSMAEHKYFAAGTAGILVLFATRLFIERPLLFGWSFLAIGGGSSILRLKDDISEKISSKQPGLAVKLLKTFFLANIFMGVLIITRYIVIFEDLIVYSLLTVFIELLTFAVIKIISAEKGKEEFVRAAQRNKTALSKAAGYLPKAALSIAFIVMTADTAYQTYLYNGDVKEFNSYMEKVYVCAEQRGDLDTVKYLEYDGTDLVGAIIQERIFGKKSDLVPPTMCIESCNDYTFSWIFRYCEYTGYTGRGY